MKATKDEVNALLDSLFLELIDLIEQQTACRVNIERLLNSGQLLLAKTRYVQGSQSITTAQIPTEFSNNFKALCLVEEKSCESKVSNVEYNLKRCFIDKENGYVNPMHWFGVLPPNSLRSASDEFKKCLEFVIESANLQREIVAVMDNIEKLKEQRIVLQNITEIKS